MNWKKNLKNFEYQKEWDNAVALMKNVIRQQPEEDAYLLFNFMLMNVLVEEEHNERQAKEYAILLLQYFKESREIFNESHSWNFYSGMTSVMSEWYMDLSLEEQKAMLQKAYWLKPENLLYQWEQIKDVTSDFGAYQEQKRLGKMILEDPVTQNELRSKGSLGDYINLMVETGLTVFDEYWVDKKN